MELLELQIELSMVQKAIE